MDSSTWFTWLIVLITGVTCQKTDAPNNSCPRDIVRQAMGCFSDLASGVTKGRGTAQFSGSMPLDYHMIREYCQEGGHMTRFLKCIDNLQKQCEHAQEAEVLLQIINPDRVRTSVPNLCRNIDLVENSAECLNREMAKESTCKNSAKEMIKKGMSETPRNVTAMFIVQCRFFNILAECQRTSVKASCGEKLANLHADFILSFVPNTCADEDFDIDGADDDSLVSTGDVTTNKPLRTSEETATMLGVYPSKKQSASNKTSDHKPEADDASGKGKAPEQVLKTLPPFVKDDDKLGLKVGLKSKRHLEGETKDAASSASPLDFVGLWATLVLCIQIGLKKLDYC